VFVVPQFFRLTVFASVADGFRSRIAFRCKQPPSGSHMGR
jgi:hypothetical protein